MLNSKWLGLLVALASSSELFGCVGASNCPALSANGRLIVEPQLLIEVVPRVFVGWTCTQESLRVMFRVSRDLSDEAMASGYLVSVDEVPAHPEGWILVHGRTSGLNFSVTVPSCAAHDFSLSVAGTRVWSGTIGVYSP